MTATAAEGLPRPEGAYDARRTLARRLAAASMLAVLAAAFCYLFMVRTTLGQRFDNAAYLGAKDQVPGVAAADGADLRRITADSFAGVLAALVILGALRRRLLLGFAAACAAGVAVVATHLLKEDILTRPPLSVDIFTAANTFPSGHTAAAVSCAMALVLVSPPRWRGVAAVVAGAYGWVTAAQVQTAGWHRPSDAIGAALIAFAAVAAAGAIVASCRPVVRLGGTRHRVAQTILGFVASIDLLVIVWGLVRVLGYLSRHGHATSVPGGQRQDAYFTGLAVTIEVVVLLLMVLLSLVGRVDLDQPAAAGPRCNLPR